MSQASRLSISREELASVVQSVFQTMLEMEVQPAPASCARAPDTITAAVHFAGIWRGAALIECDGRQARIFAQRFMGIRMPEAIDDDVRDVMGELANMVAGNLKSLLPGGVGLSMPSVVVGSDYSLRVCGAKLVERSQFTSEAGEFSVTLTELLQKAA